MHKFVRAKNIIRNSAQINDLYDLDGKKKEVLGQRLRIFIIIVALLHLGQFAAVLYVLRDKDTSFPLSQTYAHWNNETASTNTTTGPIEYFSIPSGTLDLKALLASFFFLSFFFQIVSTLRDSMWNAFYRRLEQGLQPLRWIEYAFSASCLELVICTMSGINDVHFLLILFASNFTVMLLGHIQEQASYRRLHTDHGANEIPDNFINAATPHLLGWVLFVCTWVVFFQKLLLAQNHAHGDMPTFVPILYGCTFVLFSSFGLTQVWWFCYTRYEIHIPCLNVNPSPLHSERLRYASIRSEWIYTILSLAAKSICCWIYVMGVLAYTTLA